VLVEVIATDGSGSALSFSVIDSFSDLVWENTVLSFRVFIYINISVALLNLQFFATVGWASGIASSL